MIKITYTITSPSEAKWVEADPSFSMTQVHFEPQFIGPNGLVGEFAEYCFKNGLLRVSSEMVNPTTKVCTAIWDCQESIDAFIAIVPNYVQQLDNFIAVREADGFTVVRDVSSVA